MKRILVGIPCLTGYAHCKQAIDAVVKPGVDLCLIDNGATPDVKGLLQSYKAHLIVNPVNRYVNFSWNQILEYFIANPQYGYLCIMNSDLIMQSDWVEVCQNRWAVKPDEILLPVMGALKDEVDTEVMEAEDVTSGTPGVFITLTREQARAVFPIPSEIKVWFGDNFIFGVCRGLGYRTVIPPNLLAYHYWSKTVSAVKGISEIIEEDKRQWELIKHRVDDRVIKVASERIST